MEVASSYLLSFLGSLRPIYKGWANEAHSCPIRHAPDPQTLLADLQVSLCSRFHLYFHPSACSSLTSFS